MELNEALNICQQSAVGMLERTIDEYGPESDQVRAARYYLSGVAGAVTVIEHLMTGEALR